MRFLAVVLLFTSFNLPVPGRNVQFPQDFKASPSGPWIPPPRLPEPGEPSSAPLRLLPSPQRRAREPCRCRRVRFPEFYESGSEGRRRAEEPEEAKLPGSPERLLCFWSGGKTTGYETR